MQDHKDHSSLQGAELEESLENTTDGLPTYTEALQLNQNGPEELPADFEKHLQDLPHDFHEHLPQDPGDHPRNFAHDFPGSDGDPSWDFHENLLDDPTDLPTKIYQFADEHRARGDLPKDSPLSLKVFPFKLKEPEVPAHALALKHLLKGQKMIKIYSTGDEDKDIGSGTHPVIAEVPRKLIGYFSGNFIFDWTNLEIDPCSDNVSMFLIDWMKAGGRIPLKGHSAGAYQSKDLDWLEELYTVSHKLWIYKLLEQTANDIDALNGNHKKSEALQVEARQRGFAVKEFSKQRDRAVKEAHKAQAKHFKEGAEDVASATAHVASEIAKWTGIGPLFVFVSRGIEFYARMA